MLNRAGPARLASSLASDSSANAVGSVVARLSRSSATQRPQTARHVVDRGKRSLTRRSVSRQ